MKGYRFYADLPGTAKDSGDTDPRYGDPKPLLPIRSTIKDLREYAALGGTLNCIALCLGDEHRNPDYSQECFSAVFWFPDSDVNFGGVSYDYLRKCRRIPEWLARKLHPRLFARIDD